MGVTFNPAINGGATAKIIIVIAPRFSAGIKMIVIWL